MKKILLILVVFFTTISLLVYGFVSLTELIYDAKTCERFNIDNVETRAKINVPDVTTVHCNYDPVLDRKDTDFQLDSLTVDLDIYIPANKLVLVTDLTQYPLLNASQNLTDCECYGKKYSSADHDAEALLDKKTGVLWVVVDYKQ